MSTWDFKFRTSCLSASFVGLPSLAAALGDVRPPKVGVGVVDRGGLALLEIGDVALDTILDPGTDAEKNFFEDPKTGLKDLEILSPLQCELPFGTGETRVLLNSIFLFFFEYLLSTCLKDSIEDNLESWAFDLVSSSSSIVSLNLCTVAPLFVEECMSASSLFVNLL
jgi:hypothetical protein